MRKTLGRKALPEGIILGLSAYEKISAVEGIHLSRDLKRDLLRLDSRSMSPHERSAFIAAKYGKTPD